MIETNPYIPPTGGISAVAPSKQQIPAPKAPPIILIGIKRLALTNVKGIAPSVIPINPITQLPLPASLKPGEKRFFLITVAIAYANGGIQIAQLIYTFG